MKKLNEVFVKGKKSHSNFTFVFVHGNGQNLHIWDYQLKTPLFDAFDRMAIDLPGHGGSPKCDSYEVPHLITILSDILNGLGPLLLIGHSLGGHLLIESLPKLNDCIGLILVGTPPLKRPLNMDEAFVADQRIGLLFKEKLEINEQETLIEFIGCYNNKYSAITALEQSEPKFRVDIANSIATALLLNELEILESVKFPVACVTGERDKLINKQYYNKINFPSLWKQKVLYLPNAGHSPHLETPIEFNTMVLEFVKEIIGDESKRR